MIEAKYDRNREYDNILPRVVSVVEKSISTKNDDYMLLIGGTTGTGKTTLGFHIYELYDSESCSIEYVGLNRADFAQSLNKAKDLKDKRFCMFDEADVDKRGAMTRFNREIISLYMAIRGLKMFHIWCNPSIEMLDKVFIEERVKGFIYIATKDSDRPRIYYYFRKGDLLKLFEKEGNLKLPTIKKHAKKYAFYKGWFRAYKGKLLKAYGVKKRNRMEEKVSDFLKEFGRKDSKSLNEAARILTISKTTISKRLKEGWLVEGEDYYKTDSGYYKLFDSGLSKLDNNYTTPST